VFAVLIFYGFTTVAFFKFRNSEAGNKDGYQLPYYQILGTIYLVGIIGLVLLRFFYETDKSVQDLAFVLTGIPVYFLFFKERLNS